MAAESKKEIGLEIAHVLFLDIVGYSKLSVNQQHAAVEELSQIVRASEQFQKAEATNRILKIPTGDGMADLDFAGAEAELRVAEKLAPADAGPKGALCILLGVEGRLAESENVAQQALALDPLGVLRHFNLARVLIGGGRYDEAEAALRKAVALQPAAARLHVQLTTIDVLRGNATGALQNAQLEPPGFWRDYALALARQMQSDRPGTDAALQKLINEYAASSPFQIATVYGLRNEPDKMFEWLDRAHAERDAGLTQLLVTPFILNYKDDPRFAAFCQKLKVQFPPPAGATKP
jgi:tetratricopeptide (TPR) repeat protein